MQPPRTARQPQQLEAGARSATQLQHSDLCTDSGALQAAQLLPGTCPAATAGTILHGERRIGTGKLEAWSTLRSIQILKRTVRRPIARGL